MRITAGTHRGRTLTAPAGDAVRPTTDKVRQAIFNILQGYGYPVDAVVLDGFESMILGKDTRTLDTLHLACVSIGITETPRVAPARRRLIPHVAYSVSLWWKHFYIDAIFWDIINRVR